MLSRSPFDLFVVVASPLIFATLATLMFVPVVFTFAHKRVAPAAGATPEARHV